MACRARCGKAPSLPVGKRQIWRCAAEEYLLSVAQRLHGEGLTTQIVVKVGEPADVLLDECREQAADLLVLGTHGRSGLSRLLYGSVAEAVLRRTAVPLLLIPARSIGKAEVSLPQTLVVPLDGSPLAEAALPEAFRLAQLLRAETRLVRVVPPSAMILMAEGAIYPGAVSPDIVEAEEVVAENYLSGVAERIRAHGHAVSTAVCFDQPGPAICRVAQDLPASLIVIATHARGGISRAILGSVATDVLRHATVPVLLVRPSGVHCEEQPEAAATSVPAAIP